MIINENAGSAAKDAARVSPDAIRSAFARAGMETEVRFVPAQRMDGEMRTVADRSPGAIVVGGGDGTVRGAAALLAGTDIPLGVLPLGTLNHFAKDLGMPMDLNKAVEVVAGGVVRRVDVGEVNGHVFINNCSMGAYADAVRRRDALRDATNQGKWRAMMHASWETFLRLRLLRLHVTIGVSAPQVLRTPLVVVGNNRYTGHLLNQSLRARLDEGKLWLYTVHAHRHLAVLRLMLRSMFRRLDDAQALSAVPADELVIDGLNGRIPVAADGELLELQSPLRFRIRPRALQVFAPPDGGAET